MKRRMDELKRREGVYGSGDVVYLSSPPSCNYDWACPFRLTQLLALSPPSQPTSTNWPTWLGRSLRPHDLEPQWSATTFLPLPPRTLIRSRAKPLRTSCYWLKIARQVGLLHLPIGTLAASRFVCQRHDCSSFIPLSRPFDSTPPW